jgi:hypothetical protein
MSKKGIKDWKDKEWEGNTCLPEQMDNYDNYLQEGR